MEKLIKNETYRYEDSQIEVWPYFLYEVSLYKITPKRASILSTRYYKSDKFLKVKDSIYHFKNFNIERFITLLGAPLSFIKENNLPIYILKKKNHEKRTR